MTVASEASRFVGVHGSHRFTLVSAPGPERTLWEWRVRSGELPLPMTSSSGWALASGTPSWWLGAENADGHCVGGVAIQVHGSRALPGFRILRVERFGSSFAPAARADALVALAAVAADGARLLRLHVEGFSLDGQLPGLSAAAAAAGFAPSPTPRCYGRTLLVPVGTDLDAMLGSLHATARRHIRAVGKHPVEVRPITEPSWSPRMVLLLRETLTRTGGVPETHDWPAILEFSRAFPTASRVVGLFRTDHSGPESLLAYAWGCSHGDHVHYSTAASTRDTDLRLPMAYGLVWDLIRWARDLGVPTFDFGGITEGSHADDDPLGGISDFKRYFGGVVATVGAEWVIESSPVANRLAGLVGRLR